MIWEKTLNTKRTENILLFSLFFFWQSYWLQILASISEQLQQAFESKDKASIQNTVPCFKGALLCLSTNTVLHCGVRSHPQYL